MRSYYSVDGQPVSLRDRGREQSISPVKSASAVNGSMRSNILTSLPIQSATPFDRHSTAALPRTREANASGWIEERYKLILQIEQCRVGKGWHERGVRAREQAAAGAAEVAEHAQCVDDALCSRKSAFSIVAAAARREHSSRHWL